MDSNLNSPACGIVRMTQKNLSWSDFKLYDESKGRGNWRKFTSHPESATNIVTKNVDNQAQLELRPSVMTRSK